MIETTYSVTEAEYVEAQALWCPIAVRKLPGHWLYQGTLILIATCMAWVAHFAPVLSVLAWASSVWLWFIVLNWRKKAIRKYQYSLAAERMQNVSLRIDEGGFHEHKENSGTCFIPWNQFSGWREGKSIFVLGMNLTPIPIPKSCLLPGQQASLRSTLETSIKSRT